MSLDGAKFVCLDEKADKEAEERSGKVIKAKGRKFTVGYYTNCDYILEDARAKGIHCEIICDAFGRVTINNMSEEHPIIVNDHVTNVKRPLLNNSSITILDKKFLWKFPKSSEFEDLTVEQMSTPEKEVCASKQAPSSCPDFTLHRNFLKRFTVHNFAYCIQSEGENTEGEVKENKLKQETPTAEKSGLDACDLPQVAERSVTPELSENPNTELVETPTMNLINCTKNKENASTEKKKNLLSFCHQSDVVITSFSPREAGVRIEKSFTAVLKPTTPKSVYSTPKSVLSEFNDDSNDFIDFSTPATSKKTGVSRLAKNSSMHLIDLTTPSKFTKTNRPVSPYLKSAFKSSVKKNLLAQTAKKPCGSQKLNSTETLRSNEQLGVSVLPATPIATSNITQTTQTPSSVESVISVDSASDVSSVIEVSTDAATPSPHIATAVAASPTTQTSVKSPLKTPTKSTTATPHRTPRRTPQSLMKRALIASVKKRIEKTIAHNNAINPPATPKTGMTASTSKAALLAKRQSLMSPSRKSLSASTSTSATKSSANLNPNITTGRRMSMATSTPVSRTSTSLQQLRTTASRTSSSSLHKVRKSIGNTALSSHISKTRKSNIIPTRTSPKGLSAHREAKARRSLACPTPSTSASARQQAIASTSFVKSLQSVCKQVETESKSVILISGDEKSYPALEKSSTFILDADNESTKPKELNRTFLPVKNIDGIKNVTELNKTFSPVKNIDDFKQESDLNRTFTPVKNIDDGSKQENVLNTTFSPVKETTVKRDLNKTYSPEKQMETEAEIAETIDVSIDVVAEVQSIASENSEKDLNVSNSSSQAVKDNDNKENAAECSKITSSYPIEAEQPVEQINVNTDVILESFAEVVENSTTPILDNTENQEEKVPENQEVDQLATTSKLIEVSKDIEEPTQEKNSEVELMIKEMIEKAAENIAEPTEIKDNSTVETVATVSVSESIECVENLLQETKEESDSIAILPDFAKKNKELEKCTNKKELSEEKDENDVTLTASNVAIVSQEQLHITDTSNLDSVTLDANNENNMGKTGSESQETADLLEEIEYVLNKSDELEQKHIKEKAKEDEDIAAVTGKDEEAEEAEIEEEKLRMSDSKSIGEAEKKIETENNDKHKCATATQHEDEEKEGTKDTEKTDTNPEQITSTSPMKEVTVEQSVSNEVLESDKVEKENQVAKDDNDATTTVESSSAEVIITPPTTPNLHGIREMLQTPKATEAKTPRFVGMRNLLRTPKITKRNGDDDEAEELEGIETLLKTPLVNTIQEEKEEESEEEKQKIEEKPQTSMKSTTNCNLPTLITTTPLRRSSRRASISADEAIANIYTPKSVQIRRVSSSAETATKSTLTMTPKRITSRRMSAAENTTPSAVTMTPKRITTRRMSAAESATPSTLAMTPKRITTRRPSLSLDTDDISLKLTPSAAVKRVKRVTIFEENDEDMGAIIEEEKEEVGETITDEIKLVVQEKEEVETTTDEIKLVVQERALEVSIEKQEPPIVVNSEKSVTELEVQEHEHETLKENIDEDESEIIEDSICEVISDSKSEEQMESDSKDAPELKGDKQKRSVAKTKAASIVELEIHEIEDDSLCEIIEDSNDEKKLPIATEEESKILDESDYEYGKEINKEVNAGNKDEKSNTIAETELATATTPKTKKSVKIDAPASPKTPIMIGMRELLKTPKASDKTPKLTGVCELMRTPKQSAAHADDSNLEGLTELVKTPKTEGKEKRKVTTLKEVEDLPSTSADAAAARSAEYLGMREMLITPKSCSTPHMKRIREVMQTPKICSTPCLDGIKELMDTTDSSTSFKQKITIANAAVQSEEDDEGLDQFLKTPRAKNIMIPGIPSSAVIEKCAESVELLPTTEYDLNATNGEAQLEQLFKTPVSERFVQRLDDESDVASAEEKTDEAPDNDTIKIVAAEKDEQNLSAEEAFDKLTGQSSAIQTPARNVYARKSHAHSAIQKSPFSASDVLSDLPKTDVQEWVDSLEDAENPEYTDQDIVEEQEVTMNSMLEKSNNETSCDPLINSAFKNNDNVAEKVPASCVKIFIPSDANATTTSDKMFDVSAVNVSITDPLVCGSALKTAEQRVVEKRPTTPIESEMSGINLLDETNESIFSEPLMISDSDSENDTTENAKATNKVEEKLNIDSNKTAEKIEIIPVEEVKGDSELVTIEETETVPKEDFIESLVVSDTDSSDDNLEIKEKISTEKVHAAVASTEKIKSEFENFKENAILLEQRSKTPDIIRVRSKLSRKTLGAHEDLQLTIDFNEEKSKLSKEKESATKEDNLHRIASMETIEEIIISDDEYEEVEATAEVANIEVGKKEVTVSNEEEAKPIDEESVEKTSSAETISSDNDITLTEAKVVKELVDDNITENTQNIEANAAWKTIDKNKLLESVSIDDQSTADASNNKHNVIAEAVSSSEKKVCEALLHNLTNDEKITAVEEVTSSEKKVSESTDEESLNIDSTPKIETDKIVATAEEILTETIDDQSTEDATNIEKIVTAEETSTTEEKVPETCNEESSQVNEVKSTESNDVQVTENASNETLSTIELTSSEEKMSDSNDETVVTVIAVTSSEEKVFDSCNEEIAPIEITEKIESSEEVSTEETARVEITEQIESNQEVIYSDEKAEISATNNENIEINNEAAIVEQKPIEPNNEQSLENVTNKIMETVEEVTEIEEKLPATCESTSTEVSTSAKIEIDTNEAVLENKVPESVDAEIANELIVEVPENTEKEETETGTLNIDSGIVEIINDIPISEEVESSITINEQIASNIALTTVGEDLKEDELVVVDQQNINENQISAETSSANTELIAQPNQEVEEPKEKSMTNNLCEDTSTSAAISNAIIIEEQKSVPESIEITEDLVTDDVPKHTAITEDKVQKVMPKRRGSRIASQSSQCSSNGSDAEPPKRRALRRKAETPIEEVLEEIVEAPAVKDSERITTIDFEIEIKDNDETVDQNDSEIIEETPIKRTRKTYAKPSANTDGVNDAAEVSKNLEVKVVEIPKKRTRKDSAKPTENLDEVKEDNVANTVEIVENINLTEKQEMYKPNKPSSSNAESLKTIDDETACKIAEVHKKPDENIADVPKKRTRKDSAKPTETLDEVKEDNVVNTEELVENTYSTEKQEISKPNKPISSNAESLKRIDDEAACKIPEVLKKPEENVADVSKKRTLKASVKLDEHTVEDKSNVETVENKNETESNISHKSNDASSSKTEELKTIDVVSQQVEDNAELLKKGISKTSEKPHEKAIEETSNIEPVEDTKEAEIHNPNEPSSSNVENLKATDEATDSSTKSSEVHRNVEENVVAEVPPKKRTRKASAKTNEKTVEKPVENINATTASSESHSSNAPSTSSIENLKTTDVEIALENTEVKKTEEEKIVQLPKKITRKASAKPHERAIEENSNVDTLASTNQTEIHKSNEPPSSSNVETLKAIDEATLEKSEAHKNVEENVAEVLKKRTSKASAKSNDNTTEEKSNVETVENVNETEIQSSNEPSSSNIKTQKIIDVKTNLENTKEVLKNVEENVAESIEILDNDSVNISKMDTVENKVGSDGDLFHEPSSSSSETVVNNVEITITAESDAIKLTAEDEPPKADAADLKDPTDKSDTVVENIETPEISKARKRTRKGSQSSQCSTTEDELPKRRAGRRKAEAAAPHKDIIEESEISEDMNADHVAESIEIQEIEENAALALEHFTEENAADVKVTATRGRRERKGSQSSQCSTKDADVSKRRGGRNKKFKKTALDELKEETQQTESSDIESVSDGKELIEKSAAATEETMLIEENSVNIEEVVPASDDAIKHDEALIEKSDAVIAEALEEHPKDEEDKVFMSDATKGNDAVVTQPEIIDSDAAPLRKGGKVTRAKRVPTRKATKVYEAEHLAAEEAIAEEIEVKESIENVDLKPMDIAPKQRRGGRKKNQEHVETIEDKPSNEAEENINVKESTSKEDTAQETETKTTTKRRGGRKVPEAVVPAKRRATRKKQVEQHNEVIEDHSHKTADDEEPSHKTADVEEPSHKTADDEDHAHKTADDEEHVVAKEEEKQTAEPTGIVHEKVESKNEAGDVKQETVIESDHNTDTKTETKPKARRGRKRQESQEPDDTQEPPKKRGAKKALVPEPVEIAQSIATPVAVPRRIRKASTLDVATPLQTPTRSVPRRAATAHERNYDESSDTESSQHVTYKRRSGGESNAHKAGSTEKATTSRGRKRKPTAKVQQFLEEERARTDTPKMRLLLAALDGDVTTKSATLTPAAKRGGKASTIEIDLAVSSSSTPLLPAAKKRGGRAPRTTQLQENTETEPHTTELEETTTTQSSCTEEKEDEVTVAVAAAATAAPPAKGRARARKASVVDVDTNADAIVPATTTTKRGRTARRLPSKTTEIKDHSSELEEATKPKVAKRGGRGAAAQKKSTHVDETETAAIAITNIEDMADDEEENESLAHVAEKVAATKRIAAASKDNATATKRGRGRKKVVAEDEIDYESTDSVATAATTSTRAHGGRGRKVVRFEPTDAAAVTALDIVAAGEDTATHDAPPAPPAVQPSQPAKRATRTRRK